MLTLSLVAGSDSNQAQVNAYTFSEYTALYGGLPAPAYILVTLRDISVPTQVTVDYIRKSNRATASVTLVVPPGTLAGTSFADWHRVSDSTSARTDLEDPDIQLTLLHMSPGASDKNPANWWGLRALLGNMTKLLWVIGWEKNAIRQQLEVVQAQRFLPTAVKYSLDRLGDDLGIPRFPPQPYSLDTITKDTIALYHMDEPAGATVVADAIASYPQTGLTAHPGQNNGAISGVPGRFSTGFAFRDTANSAEIVVADHPDFALGTTDSFTVECFVKPDAGPPDKETQVDHREIIAKHPNPVAGTTQAGWALSIGGFQRHLPLNIRFLLSDGTSQPILLFADLSLSGDRFYHLAGVIDRAAQQARLYINGTLVSVQSIGQLGALTNTEPLRIGHTPNTAYRGIIDEVRLSRVARSEFHPVLGEDDDVYRGRLELFRSWSLPTLTRLSQMVNAAAGPISNDPQPLILNDMNAELTGGTMELTVEPATLTAGTCIDALGNRGVDEASVNGTAAAETGFDPVYLVMHNDSRVSYKSPLPTRTLKPGELPPDTQKMQLVVAQRLNQLLDLLGSSGVLLQIISAFDPRAGDLRAVGRGLLLAPPVINASNLAQLAAQAYTAGFTFVCNRSDLNAVYVSTEPGDYIGMVINSGGTATNANGFTLHRGETLQLGVQPPLPPDTRYRWLVVPCGAGRADITPPQADLPSITLNATAAGMLNVKVEVMRRQHIAAGTSTFRVGPTPDDLADGIPIGDDGTRGVDESVAGTPDDSFFHPVYLVTHADPRGRVTYGDDVNNRRMQPSVAQHLDQLLTLIPNATIAGQQLQIVQAYVPPTTPVPNNLSGVGRALRLSHPTIPPDDLAVMAHAAGFTYVRRQVNQILVQQKPDELLVIKEVMATGPVNISGVQEVVEGQSLGLTLTPRAAPTSIALSLNAVYVANSGSDTISEIDPASGLVRRALKVGWRPSAVVLSPDGKRLYTADTESNTVTAIDVTAGNIAGVIPVRPGPIALAHHPTTQRLYVVCNADNSLLEIDTIALKVLTTPPLAVGASPTGVALTPDGSTLWVTLNGATQIAIVGTSPLATAGNITLPATPLKLAISPNGKRAYVTQPADHSIAILDVVGRAMVPNGRVVLAGATPNVVAVEPDNSAVYVTDTTPGSEQVYVLNPDGSLVQRIRVQQTPFDIAAGVVVDTNGNNTTKVMVAAQGDDDVVNVLDLQKKGVASNWRLGSGLGEHLSWVLRLGPATQVHLSSTTSAMITLGADKAGPVLVRALYVLQDNVAPYSFELRLKPALENVRTTVIRKDQFDRIMNVLNAFHPIGVEVITRAIRERVVEVRDNQLLNAFPNYTYPHFRVRGALRRRARKE